jgi:hypothetical protein
MENNQSLVEKWEQSGLLEDVKNKFFMSQALEIAASNLMYQVEIGDITTEQLKYCGALLFPLVYKVFKDKEYLVEPEVEGTKAFAVFINTAGLTEDKEPDTVQQYGMHLGNTLDTVQDVTTLCKIEVQQRETGFHLIVHLL